MGLFTFKPGDIGAIQARLTVGRDLLGVSLGLGIIDVGEETVRMLQTVTPVDPAPDNGTIPGEEGHLIDSYTVDPVQQSGPSAYTFVRTSEPIKFSYVTQGTEDKAPIVPITAKALWWPDAVHPYASVSGQAANDFVSPLVDQINIVGAEILLPYMEEWVKEMEA